MSIVLSAKPVVQAMKSRLQEEVSLLRLPASIQRWESSGLASGRTMSIMKTVSSKTARALASRPGPIP